MRNMPAIKPPSERPKAVNLLLTAEVNRKLDECQGMVFASGSKSARLSKAETINLAIEFLWARLKRTRDKVRRAVQEVEREAGQDGKKKRARIDQDERSPGKAGQNTPAEGNGHGGPASRLDG